MAKGKLAIGDVMKETDIFIKRHLNGFNNMLGKWEAYNLRGTIPHRDSPGCYLLLEGDEVIYIGLGASRGGGNYEGCGISARLKKHLYWDKTVPSNDCAGRVYKPIEKWKDVSQIYTYAINREIGYMACALEAYLISTLKPKGNKNIPDTKKV